MSSYDNGLFKINDMLVLSNEYVSCYLKEENCFFNKRIVKYPNRFISFEKFLDCVVEDMGICSKKHNMVKKQIRNICDYQVDNYGYGYIYLDDMIVLLAHCKSNGVIFSALSFLHPNEKKSDNMKGFFVAFGRLNAVLKSVDTHLN